MTLKACGIDYVHVKVLKIWFPVYSFRNIRVFFRMAAAFAITSNGNTE